MGQEGGQDSTAMLLALDIPESSKAEGDLVAGD